MTTTEAPTTFLWLEITGRCQLKCSHCYADSGPTGTHGSMTVDDWCDVINQAADLGVHTVQFIGGEPTLHPNLPELIRHALASGLAVEVFSNLVHVTPSLWEVFSLPGVSLATSYYSDDQTQHAAITGRPSHRHTLANIAEAVHRGIPLRAGVIGLTAGQRTREATAELVDLGVPRIGYDRLREVGRGARTRTTGANELCGGCGDGVAAVGPDGNLRPCVFARWVDPLGNMHTDRLTTSLDRMPAARAALIAAGMTGGHRAPCGPDGQNCYPIHCHPRT